MADSSLDDFFAKKDKSKKKTKKLNLNNQSKNTNEDGGKQSEKGSYSKKEKENSNTSPSNTQNDEEWHEYDEKEKDYTGLKIQSLQLCEKEKEDLEKELEVELDDDGEPIKSDGQSGPWKVVSNSGAEEPQPKPAETEELQKTPNVVAGKYIPPHERLGAKLQRVQMKSQRFPKVAPKIDSQNDFPSLSSAVELKSDINVDSLNFEQVRTRTRGGGREEVNGRKIGPKLDLGNKYHALGADSL